MIDKRLRLGSKLKHKGDGQIYEVFCLGGRFVHVADDRFMTGAYEFHNLLEYFEMVDSDDNDREDIPEMGTTDGQTVPDQNQHGPQARVPQQRHYQTCAGPEIICSEEVGA